MYTLDTNTLIYFFKRKGNVAQNLISKSPKDILVPAIVLYELEVGIAKSKHPEKTRKQVDTLISRVEVIPFGAREAKIAAQIRSDLEAQGTPIGPYDILIAGIALSANAILVTHNTKEFERVEGLKTEDWF